MPGKLKVPETPVWNVYTTCVISTVEVWVRPIDDDYNVSKYCLYLSVCAFRFQHSLLLQDNFVDMMNEMAEYYNQTKESGSTAVKSAVIGDFYVVLEDNNWHRVQCIDFESNIGIATVHFIDEGYEDQYKHDMLHPLEKRFCALPAQVRSIRVRLCQACLATYTFLFYYRQSERLSRV